MKAKIWTLVFTVILFAAVSGCGKTAAQETEITQQASSKPQTRRSVKQAPRRRNPSSKPVQLHARFFTATDPILLIIWMTARRSWRSGQTRRRKQTARWRFSFKDPTVRSRIRY